MGEMYEALQQLYYPALSQARGILFTSEKWKYFCWETLAGWLGLDITIPRESTLDYLKCKQFQTETRLYWGGLVRLTAGVSH